MPLTQKKKEIEEDVRRILLNNFDNDKYLWSIAHEEILNLFLSQFHTILDDCIKEIVPNEVTAPKRQSNSPYLGYNLCRHRILENYKEYKNN